MSRLPSLHDALLYNRDIDRPEPDTNYVSYEEGAARIYEMCAQRDGVVLARILREIQPIHNRYDRHERAVEIFFSSLTGGHLFPGYGEAGRREIAKEITRYFGIRQVFQTAHELETFINRLGEFLCGEKHLPSKSAELSETR